MSKKIGNVIYNEKICTDCYDKLKEDFLIRVKRISANGVCDECYKQTKVVYEISMTKKWRKMKEDKELNI